MKNFIVCSAMVAAGIFLGVNADSIEGNTPHGLYCLTDGNTLKADDYNVLVYHIQELERKVADMQKQITILHAKCRALEERKGYIMTPANFSDPDCVHLDEHINIHHLEHD